MLTEWAEQIAVNEEEAISMGMTTVSINVPQATWERFIQVVGKQKRPAEEVLIRLIQSYIVTSAKTGFYGQLTHRYLEGRLKRTGSINAFRLSADTVYAIQTAYGTTDAVELIERVRNRI